MKIQVPATTSNLGPGFDSCGLALALYLRIQIGAESAHWEVQHNLGPQIPNDQENLIVKTALTVAGQMFRGRQQGARKHSRRVNV